MKKSELGDYKLVIVRKSQNSEFYILQFWIFSQICKFMSCFIIIITYY